MTQYHAFQEADHIIYQIQPENDADSIVSAPESAYVPVRMSESHEEKSMFAEPEAAPVFVPPINKKSRLRYLWPAQSRSQSFYLAASIVCAAVVLGLEIYIFYVFSNHLPTQDAKTKIRSLQTYLGLFIFATAYQLVITYLSILKNNFLQLAILCAFLLAMVIYSGVQFNELQFLVNELEGDWKRATTAAIVIIIIVLCLTLILETMLAFFKLQREFGWNIYRDLGASVDAKRNNKLLQIYKSLILFDAFFFPAFTIQFIIINIERSDPEFYITIVMLPLTFVVLFLAQYAIWKQKRWLIPLCAFAYVIGLAYVLFKICRLYTYHKYNPDGYLPGRISLTVFAVITIMLLLTTIAFTVIVWFRFDRLTKFNKAISLPDHSDESPALQAIFEPTQRPVLLID